MHRWLASPLALLAAAAAVAQDAPLGEPAPTAAELAFATVSTRMTVPVSIAGAGPYRFIIDTGAQRSVVSRQLAGRLGLAPGRKVRMTAMTGTSNVGTVVIPSLAVSTLKGERIEAPALDALHMGAIGILGIDTLQGHRVSIDFDAGSMTLTPSRKRRRATAGPNEIVVKASNLFGQLVVTDAEYAGRKVRVILDTGSMITMGNAAFERRAARAKASTRPVELMSVTGETMVAPYTQVKRVRLGEVTFTDLPIAFSDAAPFRQFGLVDEPAMLLGMDALRLFRRVEIDFPNREVRLLMPRGFRAR